MQPVKRVLTLLLSVILGVSATAIVATPAQAAYSDCPAGWSCYWTGLGGSGGLWLAPSPGCHNLPGQRLSIRNLGGGSIALYVGTTYTGWTLAIGYQGNNPSPAADRICIAF